MKSISIGPHITQPPSLGSHYRNALPSNPPLTPRVTRNVHTRTSSSLIAGYLALTETTNLPAGSNVAYEVYFNSEMKRG